MNVCVRHTETDSMRGEDKRSEKESVRERMTLCGPVSDRMRENVCEREREREREREGERVFLKCSFLVRIDFQ